MANFDANSLRILEQIEDEFRNQYWIIRNSRRTNWRAVNSTRMLGDFMYLLGVPKWAVQQARYCLRLRVCERCFKDEFRCHGICGRAKRGDFDT
ncbi:hypothetical protein [Janthinobacterium sp.]|uniref:hypothetical protein n=1 Tax=Janthinobacterium sp. TaxID=1871054 RepID=UPI002DB78743|nr:hypothetical protein [Janthinobacterium sp.]HEU4819496.1 hypothetical protein [Janthinobacterium sp.]